MEQQIVSLEGAQREWLKRQTGGISGTIRLLITDAMERDRKRKVPTKADIEAELLSARSQAADAEARLRSEVNARLQAEQAAAAVIAANKTKEEKERERQTKWDAYRDTHAGELEGASLETLKALKDRVAGGS